MGFLFIYEPGEYRRIIPAVLIDGRDSNPAIANQNGFVIKAYCDAETEKIKDNVLFFRIETINNKNQIADGVLAGYFSIEVFHLGNNATLLQLELRPAFRQFSTQISAEISIFISSGNWKQYYL